MSSLFCSLVVFQFAIFWSLYSGPEFLSPKPLFRPKVPSTYLVVVVIIANIVNVIECLLASSLVGICLELFFFIPML